MSFTIKNNNLYYYHYLISDKQLSLILVPIAFIIIYYDVYIKYFNYIFIYIALIGIIDNYFKFKKHKLYFIFISILIFHLILLYPLINFKKYMKPNIINYILSLLAIFIIIFLPFWPYELSREIFILVLIIVYIVCTLFNFI